jgi:hypothetical protein
MSPEYVRTVRAFEGETVEIQWICSDGTRFWQRVTIPPKPTRVAVNTAEKKDS